MSEDKKPWPEPKRLVGRYPRSGPCMDEVAYCKEEAEVIEEVIKLALWACRPVPRPDDFYDEDGEINEGYLEFLDEGDPTSTTSQEFLYDALEALQKGRKGRNGDT